MAIELSSKAIALMCKGEVNEEILQPILQVTELKLVKTTNQQQATERYRMLVSDGVMMQQGMLGTQMNHLVKDGRLQVGSVVQLNKYVCNLIQQRMIIIIIELDVLVEKCDIIGQPAMARKPGEPSPIQPSVVPGKPQSLGGSSVTNSSVASDMQMQHPRPGVVSGNPQLVGSNSITNSSVSGIGAHMQHPRPGIVSGNSQFVGSNSITNSSVSGGGVHIQNPRANQPVSNLYSGNPDSGRFSANNSSSIPVRTEHNSSFPGSAPLSGSYGNNQNRNFNNPREISRAPSTGYVPPPQRGYQQQQRPPMYGGRGPIARNEAPPSIIPISALNPYQGRWTIKARVTAKSELRLYNNARGDGKIFSFDLLDHDGGEIRVTCFNAVADQFYNQIECGRVYMISKGNIKGAQKAYNHLPNEHEIHLEASSVVQPCFEDDEAIPQQQFHFRPISDIEGLESKNVLDLIGLVTSIGPATSIMRKNGTETQKRTLQLKDRSGRSVEVTLWGNFANEDGHRLQCICDSGNFPVLAVKAGLVNDFNGKSVGTISSSQLFIDPDFQEARDLKCWFDREGKNMVPVSISRESSSFGKTDSRKTISQIKDEKLGIEKADWILVNAWIIYLKHDNFCYTACPLTFGDRVCSKKVTNNGDGTWRCDRCDKSVEECDYRYILQFQIQDHTGLTWVTSFQECGEEIMGISAKDLYFLKFEHQDDEKVSEIIREALFKRFLFKLKVKEETVNDEQRVKSTVVKVEKVNHMSEPKFLLDMIDKIQAGDCNSTTVKTESTIHNPGDFEIRQTPAAANPYMNSHNSSVREFGLPANQVGPHGNQYSGSRLSVPANVTPSCSCGVAGHTPMNCPSLMSVPGMGGYGGGATGTGGASVGSSSECYKCHQVGHWARDCPGSASGYNRSGISQGGYGRV
ncbi:hypothetical protein ACFE04_001788 [Oxalis oulophora]